MAPKGLPKSGAGTLAKVDFGNQLSRACLALAPGWVNGSRCQELEKCQKKITASPSPARTARSALSAWQGAGLLKLAALQLGEAEEAALQLLR